MNQNQTPTPTTPDDRKGGFVAVQGGSGESADAGTLLVAAYLLMWALLLGFVWLTWRRQGRLDSRVDELERALTKAEKSQQ